MAHRGVGRVACAGCEKTTQVDVPWPRAGQDVRQTLEAFVVALCEQLPVLAVAQLLGVSDDRIWRALDRYVERVRAREAPSASARGLFDGAPNQCRT